MNKPSYSLTRVLENVEVAEGIYSLAVEGKFEGAPGQFYMLRAWEEEPLLSRPLSIYRLERDKICFLYHVGGRGTELLSRLDKGAEIKLTGPLGYGFEPQRLQGRIALVAGGIGIAPFDYTIKALKDNPKVTAIDLYAGFRSETYGLEEIEPLAEKVEISTEDGSAGYKGYVTDLFNPRGYDMVLCCGPTIMMKKVIESCKEAGVKVLASMEERMACGIGACLVCTCKTKDGNKRSCKDGPVFEGEELVL